MARYQLTLAYDGTGFFGSQRQAKKRTVQGELEKVLRALGWKGRSILLSGRTDTGVHASGQVVAADFDWSHPDSELIRALNAKLPLDMSVREARKVRDDFHPRFDALSRTYHYRLFFQPIRDPLRERYSWRIPARLNGSALGKAAKLFAGTHDFHAFGSPTTPGGTTIRTVIKTEWAQVSDDEWQFEVQADAFLYRMVRRMVFVQTAAARGTISLETVAESLAKQAPDGKSTGLPSGLAPANGLTLVGVRYHESM